MKGRFSDQLKILKRHWRIANPNRKKSTKRNRGSRLQTGKKKIKRYGGCLSIVQTTENSKKEVVVANPTTEKVLKRFGGREPERKKNAQKQGGGRAGFAFPKTGNKKEKKRMGVATREFRAKINCSYYTRVAFPNN